MDLYSKNGKPVFRTKIEMSGMDGNDEYSYYSDLKCTDYNRDRFVLVVSRPVFQIEINEGLKNI